MADVKLDDEVLDLIQEQVEKGAYADASEVVRDALRLLQQRQKANHVRDLLLEARAEYDRGEYYEGTPDFLDRIVEELDEEERLGIEIESVADAVV